MNDATTPLLTVISVIKEPAAGFEKTRPSVYQEFGDYANVEYLIKEWSPSEGESVPKHPVQSAAKANLTVRHIYKTDCNVFDGMNQAVKAARGTWIVFLNAGDWFIAGFGEACLRFLEQHSDADYVYADGVTVDAIDGREFLRQAPEHLTLADFLHRAPYLHPCMFVKRTVLLKYAFDIQYDLAADYKLMVQLVSAGKQGHHLAHPAACILSGGLSERHRVRAKRQAYRALLAHSPNLSFQIHATTAYLHFLILHTIITIVRKIPPLHRLAKKRTKGKPSGTY